MIDEPELRELFAAESAESLERMEAGLLALERTPEERSLVESVFRQAHSLKGSAASLGLSAVESVAHHFEDALDAARHGRVALTPERADQLYRALDALRGLVEEQVTGRSSGVDLKQTLEALSKPPSPPIIPPTAVPSEAPAVEEAAPTLPPPPAPASHQATPTELPVITEALVAESVPEAAPSTVRVETVRLDRALADMGDLVVTSARVGLRRSEAAELLELHEAWARDWRLRGAVSGVEGERLTQFGTRLEGLIRALTDDQTRLEQITEHLREEIQEMRLVPLSGLFGRFPRVVRDLARQEGKEIRLVLEGGETTADRRLLERLNSPLTHLVRNAVDHGVEPPGERSRRGKPAEAAMRLSAVRRGPLLEVSLEDDGGGLDLEAIARRALESRLRTAEQLAQASEADLSALIFVPGFSTRTVVSDLSGRGTGLDAVRSDVEGMGGTIGVESSPGGGTAFRLRIPLTLATSQVMVCSCSDRLFAIPLAFVERTLVFEPGTTFPVEGRPCLEVEGTLVPVSGLDALLGGAGTGGAICLILSDQAERHGFIIEDLLGVMEIVVKPFHESRLVGGASILPDGRVCLVLQSTELLRQAHGSTPLPAPPASEAPRPAARVLLAEDSPTVAARARRLLEAAGYQVVQVGDGAQAWKLACEQPFDAVVSDIEMPFMDGLELTRRLRGLASYSDVPILLITSLSGEDSRLAGLEAGASAYLGKSTIDEGTFLPILERLL